MERVTLATVAKEAGVSTATASMAIRGKGMISQATAERVREVASRLGYVPDPVLSAIAKRRFRTNSKANGLPIALLVLPLSPTMRATPTMYVKAIEDSAMKLGYAVAPYTLGDVRKYSNFPKMLYNRGTAGVIVLGQADPRMFEDHSLWKHFALVQCGRYENPLPIHTVRPDIHQAVRMCFDQAVSRGYRRIGFALGKHDSILEDDLARLGAAMALSSQFLKAKDRVKPYDGPLFDSGKIMAWGEQNQVDAYIGFTGALYYYLKEHGIRFPEDKGFISLHAADFHSEISGANQRSEDIANQAILQIDQLIRHNHRGFPEQHHSILVPSTWVEGTTLAEQSI